MRQRRRLMHCRDLLHLLACPALLISLACLAADVSAAARAQQKRDRAGASTKKGPTSNLAANAQALTIICSICRQTFLKTAGTKIVSAPNLAWFSKRTLRKSQEDRTHTLCVPSTRSSNPTRRTSTARCVCSSLVDDARADADDLSCPIHRPLRIASRASLCRVPSSSLSASSPVPASALPGRLGDARARHRSRAHQPTGSGADASPPPVRPFVVFSSVAGSAHGLPLLDTYRSKRPISSRAAGSRQR